MQVSCCNVLWCNDILFSDSLQSASMMYLPVPAQPSELLRLRSPPVSTLSLASKRLSYTRSVITLLSPPTYNRIFIGLLVNDKSVVTRKSFIVFLFFNRVPISDVSANLVWKCHFFGHEIRHMKLRSTLIVSKFLKNWTNHKMI